ncbi:MAG: type II toxin-antitoxin system RelE/ParE family toxin [Candidatus Aminicenantales bacterium]
MRRKILFFRTAGGKCPIEEFLDFLPGKTAQKITWVLKLIEDLEFVPATYFVKLPGTEEIWECRVNFSSNTYRILSFFKDKFTVVMTHGFMKKTKKTPRREIDRAESYRRDYLRREAHHE